MADSRVRSLERPFFATDNREFRQSGNGEKLRVSQIIALCLFEVLDPCGNLGPSL
jgi:hypothetical protein